MTAWSRTLHDACVRVDAGTGFLLGRRSGPSVIVTAAHVVADRPSARVTWREGAFDADVLAIDRNLDVAVLSDHPQVERLPRLELAATAPPLAAEVAYAGFPTGWEERTPVIQRGYVAVASPDELWVDGSANPGNSGGPIITHDQGELRVVGVLLGRAGDVDESLRKFSEEADRLRKQASALSVPLRLDGVDFIGDLARIVTAGLVDMAGLLERHFRTGLIRAAGIDRIARQLGT